MNNLLDVYFLLTIPFGWAALSRLQSGFVIFTSIEKYIVFKFALSLFIGWLVAPFYILGFIFKLFRKSKKATDSKDSINS